MAGIETYGGCCPICLKSMFQKHESSGGFMFDACSWCGFIYYESHFKLETTAEDNAKTWEDILEHYQVVNLEELCQKVAKVAYTPEDNKEFFPSIFKYTDEEQAHPIYKILWEVHVNGPGDFSMEGLRVYKKEDIQIKGFLLEYKEGKVLIDWQAVDGTSFTEEINAIEIGRTIILSSEPSLKNMVNQAKMPFL